MGYSATVPRFGMVVEVNLARTFLFRAHEALEAGRIFEAGVLLREAIRRQLVAECKWHDCLPKEFSDFTPPIVLLKAMRCAGKCGRNDFEWHKDMIQTANRCCHAQAVDANKVRFAISIMHMSIDSDPCGEPKERVEHCLPAEAEPTLEGNADYDVDDCGDDDRRKADWWKPGDWTPEL